MATPRLTTLASVHTSHRLQRLSPSVFDLQLISRQVQSSGTNSITHQQQRRQHHSNIMADRYDDLERRFGISSYASPHDGFAAVVKARYSDFIVHEGEVSLTCVCSVDGCVMAR